MKTGFIYRVEGAEKITNNGMIESGGTIFSNTFKTESQAKKAADKILKRKDILSVWVYKVEADEQGDPLYQWVKYEDDVKWSGGCYW
jgi:hypothetical protein